jgi:IclR family acetate operon transcriptional repressor
MPSPSKKTNAVAPKKPHINAPGQDGKYSVPVVRSTFRILQELGRAELLGLSEITQRTGISKSTVFRILSTLQELGYVLRDADRIYRISPTLAQLAGEEAAGEALRRLALPHMLELRDKYGETVNLGVRYFDKVTYLEVVPSEFALRLEEVRGASVPVHASSLGKAILAFSPRSTVESLVRGRPLERITPNTICDPDEFLAELKRVNSAGFAFDRGEGSLLAVCIGAPILDAQGDAIAALSISGPAQRFRPKKDAPVIASLLNVTTEISRTLARSAMRSKPVSPPSQ